MAEGALIVPRLETKRLLLIPFSLEMKRMTLRDKSRLAGLIEARVSEDWPGDDLMDALPFFIAQIEKNPSDFIWDGLIVHKADRVLIGDIGFKGGPDAAGAIEIGYSIIPEYRGHGYMTEMAKSLIDWAFQQPEINLVTAECLDDNIGSIKVLEKLGMRRVAHEGNMLKWELRRNNNHESSH